MMCNLFLLSKSSERKRTRRHEEENKKWNIDPFVGLKGILKFYGKSIKFMVEEINKKNVKYKYRVSYPNGEYAKNWIGLDLKNKKYITPAMLGKGSIIDIQRYVVRPCLDSEEAKMDWFDDLDQRDKDNAVQLLSQSIQHYNGLKEDVLIDMRTKFGLIPAQTQQLYEFLNLKENIQVLQVVEEFDLETLEIGTQGILLPTIPRTAGETEIKFKIVSIEKDDQYLKIEPNKKFCVSYICHKKTDEYITIRKDYTYSDSNHFGKRKIQLKVPKINLL